MTVVEVLHHRLIIMTIMVLLLLVVVIEIEGHLDQGLRPILEEDLLLPPTSIRREKEDPLHPKGEGRLPTVEAIQDHLETEIQVHLLAEQHNSVGLKHPRH